MIQKQRKKLLNLLKIVVSTAFIVFALAFPVLNAASSARLTNFVYPILAPEKSSDFGIRKHPIYKSVKHHDGVDLAAPKGAPIRSIMDGWVVHASSYARYGKLVTVRHDNDVTSHYAHCDDIKVKVGQHVKAGQIIGTVGETGSATGPHLHFEIRFDGKPYDPERLVPDLMSQAKG